ncbi:MAG: amino acid adenylation domain-containing protein [Tenuifilaceae bacterium]
MKINIIEYFIETVKLKPNRKAVIEGEKHITFIDLQNRALNLANGIIEIEELLNKPIGVYLPKSIETVVANTAITYSGNIYMNLDVKAPLDRIKNIVNLIQPKFIITNTQYFKIIENIISSNTYVILMDVFDWYKSPDYESVTRRLAQLIDTDPYCIINTSGSTGTPKGVILNHKSFFDFTEWSIDTLSIHDNEIVGSLSPIIFDIYSHELCMMMAKGSTIVLLPESLSAFPIKILEMLKKEKVTYIFWVPTIMVNIANMDLLSRIELNDLKTVWFAGEVLPTKQYNYWHHHLPNTRFINLYGPIEITLDCTYYIVDREFDDNEPLPIGFACRNTSLLILDNDNNPCMVGQEGELCVRGTSLAMGYYNNHEKTAAAFTQNPLNSNYPEIIYRTGDIVMINELGEIMFKGRRDTLIKHLGYRIELGEIEHVVVNSLKLVSNGCVIYNSVSKDIILIYESQNDIHASEFRKHIGQSLPKYMIPTKYVRVENMPMNANGKIDRLKLNKEFNG